MKELLTLSDGQQVLTSTPAGVSVEVTVGGARITKRQDLAISDEYFLELSEHALTKYLKVDTIGAEIRLMPKKTKQRDQSK